MSAKFTAMKLWRTRASPGPGSPTSTLSNFRTSAPPVSWKRMALVMSCLLVNACACEDEILAGPIVRAKRLVQDDPKKQVDVPDKQDWLWRYAGYLAHRQPLADMPLTEVPNETATICTARHAVDRMLA